MKNIWIIANWKSNKTIKEALDWISYVGPKLEKREHVHHINGEKTDNSLENLLLIGIRDHGKLHGRKGNYVVR